MSNISGFYYDIQKKNPLMSMSLHANTKLNSDGKEWARAEKNTTGVDSNGYYTEALCRAIVNEDFQIGIVNNWSDFDQGDPLGAIFNSIRQYAPMTEAMSSIIKSWDTSGVGEFAIDTFGSNFGSRVYGWADQFKDFAGPALDVAGDYLNRNLVTQGNRFAYYSGTGVSFGNLGLKFTIFADWITEINAEGKTGEAKFKTVNEQLESLIPYIIGRYVPFWEENKEAGINTFLGWQTPPAGYRANLKSVYKEDTTGSSLIEDQQGTLKLRLGGFYALTNLVVKDVQLNFSKQMAKSPESDYQISPLYCEVMLQLQPVVKYTDHALKDFIGGKSTVDERSELANILKNSHVSSKDY